MELAKFRPQQGQAEANIQPVFAHQEMGFYEVQQYMIFARQSQFVATLMGNEQWYDGLSEERRAMVDKVVGKLVREGHELQTGFNKKRLKAIRKDSDIEIIELNDAQREAFREQARPVRQIYIDEVGERGQRALDTLLQAFDQAGDPS